MRRTVSRWLAIVGVLAIVAAACGSDESSSSTTDGGSGVEPAKTYSEIGATEGELNLIAWNGYTEDGSVDKNFDWVTPFEDQSGCNVTVKYADTSDEMVTLMRQGGGATYDGVSASGDASNRLIAGGDVGAVDPSLFPDLANVIAPLSPTDGTNNAHYVVDGNVYGTPWMYGPNFLMYNTDVVKPAPTSWDITFETDAERPAEPVRGQADRLRLGDLHRRRGDVPDDAAARPRHHRPVRAHPGPAGRGRRTAEAAVDDDRQVLGALHRRDRRLRRRLDGGGHRVADQPQLRRARRTGGRGTARPRA